MASEPAQVVRPSAAASAPAGFWDRLGEPRTTAVVILLALLLYIPMAGSYGLWDPWETHYSEVARQMTRRGDFISLWWPCSPRETVVFQTKPVFTFWLMSLGMHVARIGLPGSTPGEMALGTTAEWAVRVPFCLLGVMGIYGVYLVTSRLASRRAGVLAALATATCPIYALVARQAMTDMTYVGPATLALALAALALHDEDLRELPRRGRGWLSWPHHPLFYLALGSFLLVMLPQLLIDSIDLRVRMPWRGRSVTMYGAVVMIPYWVGTAAVVVLLTRARFRRPLYLCPAAVLCGLAILGKGLAGLGLPVIIFAAYLVATGQWRRLGGRQLPIALGAAVVVVALVAVPWHHAMYIRHGAPWWNELFGDNHWNRMMIGRHGDTGAFEYFLRELAYGAWPLLPLAPAALTWAAAAGWSTPARLGGSSWSSDSPGIRGSSWTGDSAGIRGSSWTGDSPGIRGSSWTGDSPGIRGSSWTGDSPGIRGSSWTGDSPGIRGSSWTGDSPGIRGSSWTGDSPGFRGSSWTGDSPGFRGSSWIWARPPALWLGVVWMVSAYAVVSLSMTKFHHYILPAVPGLGIVVGCFLDHHLAGRRRLPAVAALVGLPLFALVTADLVSTKNAAQRFLWLFSYDYVHSKTGRAWPDALDFRPGLIVLAVLIAAATAALAFRRTSRVGLGALVAGAVLTTYFLLDHLMPSVAPYWSQKGVIASYYRQRSGPEERLVAFQMFWRGESFYTSNEIYEGPHEDRTVFDSDDIDENLKRLRDWIARNRGRRHFFLFENARESQLRTALPPGTSLQILDRTNNKFVLASAHL